MIKVLLMTVMVAVLGCDGSSVSENEDGHTGTVHYHTTVDGMSCVYGYRWATCNWDEYEDPAEGKTGEYKYE